MSANSKFVRRSLRRLGFRHAAFLAMALLLLALFAVFHILGWRDDTAIISGTAASPTATLCGLLYAGSYFAAVTISPILIIATAISAVSRRLASAI